MSNDHLDLRESSALGDNSRETMDQSDTMRQEVDLLISEIEDLSRALQGPAGDRLKEGVGGLASCLTDLLGWCSQNGMNMAEAHALLGNTESEATELYAKEASNFDGLTRSVNS